MGAVMRGGGSGAHSRAPQCCSHPGAGQESRGDLLVSPSTSHPFGAAAGTPSITAPAGTWGWGSRCGNISLTLNVKTCKEVPAGPDSPSWEQSTRGPAAFVTHLRPWKGLVGDGDGPSPACTHRCQGCLGNVGMNARGRSGSADIREGCWCQLGKDQSLSRGSV